GLRAGAAARAARDGDLERHGLRRPASGLDELDLDLGQEVGAASALRPPRAAEQVLAEEGGEQVADAPEIEVRREAAAAQPFVAEAVVELPPLRVREDLVGLDDLLEALLGVRLVRDVRVQLPRELAERLLDLRVIRGAGDAEQLVVVAGRRHSAEG